MEAAEAMELAEASALKWGRRNVNGHFIKHRALLGHGNKTPQEAQKLLPDLKNAANRLLRKADPKLTRVGRWHEIDQATMCICDGKMVVMDSSGNFVTILGKTSNNWYAQAQPVT